MLIQKGKIHEALPYIREEKDSSYKETFLKEKIPFSPFIFQETQRWKPGMKSEYFTILLILGIGLLADSHCFKDEALKEKFHKNYIDIQKIHLPTSTSKNEDAKKFEEIVRRFIAALDQIPSPLYLKPTLSSSDGK